MATRLPLNTFRSLVLVLGGLALAANWLYVPWTYTLQRPGSAQVRTPGGYAFLNSPPPRLRQTNVDGVEIDFGRVLLQTAALGAVALVGLSLLGLIGQLRGRGPSPARSRSPKPCQTRHLSGGWSRHIAPRVASLLRETTHGDKSSGIQAARSARSQVLSEHPPPARSRTPRHQTRFQSVFGPSAELGFTAVRCRSCCSGRT